MKHKQKVSANLCSGEDSTSGISTQQLEQLQKLLPLPSRGGDEDSGEEMEVNYAKIIECNMAQALTKAWIIDSGATHHISGGFEVLKEVKKSVACPKITEW